MHQSLEFGNELNDALQVMKGRREGHRMNIRVYTSAIVSSAHLNRSLPPPVIDALHVKLEVLTSGRRITP